MLQQVRAAAGGDRIAAEQLLRGVLPRVRNLVRYLVRGDAGVDDICQEALIAVLRGLKTFRAEGSFESWVDRVVARVVFAERRRARKDRPVSLTSRLEPVVAATAPRQEEYLRRRQIARILDAIPDAQREALVLHHVVGMSIPEVAKGLGLPAETVRSRIRLGRERFQALCQDSGWTPRHGGSDSFALAEGPDGS